MPPPRAFRRGTAALFLPVALLAGCGGASTLDGTVTLDGQPVDGGTIALTPANGSGPGGGGPIQDGKYSIDAGKKLPAGTYKVEINWLKKTGKALPNTSDPGTSLDETKQVIPMEYNSKTKLTAEVKSGSNTANFELKSGGAVSTAPAGAPPPRSKAVGD